MNITKEELKQKILELIKEDEDFAMELNRTILKLYSDKLLTKTYLDEALAKQSKDFDEKLSKLSKDFDEKLAKQSKEFDEKLSKLSREFDEKLAKQSKEFDEKLSKLSKDFDDKLSKLSREFDEKLAKQSKEFDEKLMKWANAITEKLTNRINAIGGRWGIDAENAIRKFAEKIVSEWGGSVKKWKKKVEFSVGNATISKEYEIDIIMKDGKEIAIEVKASFNKDSMEKFIEACSIYTATEKPQKELEKLVITFFIYEDAKKIADANNVEIIIG